MKFNIKNTVVVAAIATMTMPASAAEVTGWGDFKLYLDPGHAKTENGGLYSYSEAEKVLRVAHAIREYLLQYTDVSAENIKLCRETDNDYIDLTERVDVANAWGADFYYSIHSDAGDSYTPNTTVTLFGGWRNNGEEIEKTPNGGKAFGDYLCPNLTGVMQVSTRGNWYDRCYYDKSSQTHTNQYPYLAVNRRSTMPSLLSEGGYHTNAYQQQRNLNASYKRLEAYAAFRSLLQYRGLNLPEQPLLVGVVKNSENDVPVNGVTIAVGDQTITTDTYESLFNKYSKDPNMLHNGFFMFEGLQAGVEYTVTFTHPDFTTVEKKMTLVSNTTDAAADNVTWCDINLTSIAPSKIDQISVDDLLSVKLREPIKLTFSRNMDRESVEQAFSINNDAQVSLSWKNDYTLLVDISTLENSKTYVITIDGSVAKNSQTSQLFDGDGDGIEGGNYVLEFTTEPLDNEAPQVVSVDPAVDGEALGTYRPVIRIELSEEIPWNEDKYASLITVEDADGNTYAGSISHVVINERSVIHYKFNEDLPLDKCFRVNVAGGIADFLGNMSEPYSWKFLSDYRATASEIVVSSLDSATGWWAPSGSGSSSGLVEDANTWSASTTTYSSASSASMKLGYAFDENATTPSWMIREYCSAAAGKIVADNINGSLKFWLYGDGSNNSVSVMVRANKSSGGLKHPVMTSVDFCGWKQIVWDMKNDSYEAFTGTDELTGAWILDSFFIVHKNTDDTDTPQAWSGSMLFDDLIYTVYDEASVRTASLSDIDDSSVDKLKSHNMFVYRAGDMICVEGDGLRNVSIVNLAGQVVDVRTALGNNASVNIASYPTGMYLVKVNTANGVVTKKFVK